MPIIQLTEENFFIMVEALEKIAYLNIDNEHEIIDEWAEAACFHHCQKIALNALQKIKDV